MTLHDAVRYECVPGPAAGSLPPEYRATPQASLRQPTLAVPPGVRLGETTGVAGAILPGAPTQAVLRRGVIPVTALHGVVAGRKARMLARVVTAPVIPPGRRGAGGAVVPHHGAVPGPTD